jgi:hypothetical protein
MLHQKLGQEALGFFKLAGTGPPSHVVPRRGSLLALRERRLWNLICERFRNGLWLRLLEESPRRRAAPKPLSRRGGLALLYWDCRAPIAAARYAGASAAYGRLARKMFLRSQ